MVVARRRGERPAFTMLVHMRAVEPGGVGVPVGEVPVRQKPGVGHGGFGHLNVVERGHALDFRRYITPMEDRGVAEVQMGFVEHHVVGVSLPGTGKRCPRRVVDPRHMWELAARGRGWLPQPDPDERWLLEDGEYTHPHPSRDVRLGRYVHALAGGVVGTSVVSADQSISVDGTVRQWKRPVRAAVFECGDATAGAAPQHDIPPE